MSSGAWRVEELLPHAGPAVLLSDVIGCSDTGVRVGVTLHRGSPFFQADGVPAHVGIEYMAQACGVFSGIQAKRGGAAPRMGFLLGTRHYRATRAWFRDGERLVVAADLVYFDDEIGMFDCAIHSGYTLVADARLVVAEPRDAATMLGRRDGMDDG